MQILKNDGDIMFRGNDPTPAQMISKTANGNTIVFSHVRMLNPTIDRANQAREIAPNDIVSTIAQPTE